MPISSIVKKINVLKDSNTVGNLKVTDVTKWLLNNDFLYEYVKNGEKRKMPTDKGKLLGIYSVHRISFRGEYDVVMYNEVAEKFVVDNIFTIIKSKNSFI